MLKAILYPFDISSVSLVRYSKLIKEYNIISCVSLPCYNLDNLIDISFFDEKEKVGIEVNFTFSEQIKKCDCIIWCESWSYNLNTCKTLIVENIKKAIKHGKKIFCIQHLDDELLNEFKKYGNESFLYLNNEHLVIHEKQIMNHIHVNNNIKVTFLQSIVDLPNCGELFFKIKTKYLDKNTIFMSKNAFGFFTNDFIFPKGIFSEQYNYDQIVVMFYNYIQKICKENKTNHIIIEVPTPLFPVQKNVSKDFGLLFGMITPLFNNSEIILELDCDYLTSEYLDYIEKIYKYKYGQKKISYYMSNIHLDKNDLQKNIGQINYEFYPVEYVNKIINKSLISIIPHKIDIL